MEGEARARRCAASLPSVQGLQGFSRAVTVGTGIYSMSLCSYSTWELISFVLPTKRYLSLSCILGSLQRAYVSSKVAWYLASTVTQLALLLLVSLGSPILRQGACLPGWVRAWAYTPGITTES